MEYNTLNIQEDKYTVTVWLNRPKVHNAINGEMIHELLHFFSSIACNKQTRAVIIRGRGSSFCSGADLNWMKEVSGYNYDQNFLDSHTLAKCLFAINSCSKVVISAVHGAVMGGANGLVAASDVVVATGSARFAMSEVSLGLLPAVISPYLVEKIGYSNARRYMLLADSFTAADAQRMGLVHFVVEEGNVEAEIDRLVNQILKNSPDAILRTKNLLQELKTMENQEAVMQFTSEEIARARVSEEGQEGMAAFFRKQKPEWAVATEKNIGEVN